MVTRETSYIGHLYFGLSTDDTADIAEWHNGDRILLMDLDQMYVYDEAALGFKQISMGGGGGGGGGSTIVSKTITANGTYYASADSADGYNPVTVNVSAPPPTMENLVFKLNNQVGVALNFFSAFYDSDRSFITLYIYAAQSNNTSVQKTCLIQNGTVQLGMANNRTITSITYNGNPVAFTQSGSGQRRYIEFTVPDNFDPDIDIIFK